MFLSEVKDNTSGDCKKIKIKIKSKMQTKMKTKMEIKMEIKVNIKIEYVKQKFNGWKGHIQKIQEIM